MAIPVESRETEDFTPQSLECMGDDAPIFRLKAPSERCRRRFRQLCGDDGLATYSQEEFDAEKFKAIDLYWEPDVAVQYRLKFVELLEKIKQGIDCTPEELAWINDLDETLFDAHKPLRVMRRKTGEFNEFAPRYAMAVYLAGWRNLDAPFKLDAGVISQESIDLVAKELGKLGAEHCPAAPSAPFIELYVATSRRLSLTEEEEKNSPSPSQPTATPDALTAATNGAEAKTKEKPSSGGSSTDSPNTSSSPEASLESA